MTLQPRRPVAETTALSMLASVSVRQEVKIGPDFTTIFACDTMMPSTNAQTPVI